MTAKDHRKEMLVMGKERDAALDALAKAQAALSTARQSRKRAVCVAQRYRERAWMALTMRDEERTRVEDAEAERDAAIAERDGLRIPLAQAVMRLGALQAERALSQQLWEDNDDLSIDPIRLQAVIDAFTRTGEAGRALSQAMQEDDRR